MKNQLIKKWVSPLLAAGLIFWMVRPSLAQILPEEAVNVESPEWGAYSVGVEVKDGFSQVYYQLEGEQYYVEQAVNQNKRQPDMNGPYMVWVGSVNGAGQIYRYHIPSKTLLQITSASTNIQPKVNSDGKVVWQRWVENNWQVYYFDGIRVSQVSSERIGVNPDIGEEGIVYVTQTEESGQWVAIYTIPESGFRTIVAEGPSVKYPQITKDKLQLGSEAIELLPLKQMSESRTNTSLEELTTPAVAEEEIVQEISDNLQLPLDTDVPEEATEESVPLP